jgi:hypothetical protein
VNDMIADSLIALAMQAQTSPGGIRLTSNAAPNRCRHPAKPADTASAAAAAAVASGSSSVVKALSTGDEQLLATKEREAGVAHGLAAALSLVTATLRDRSVLTYACTHITCIITSMC